MTEIDMGMELVDDVLAEDFLTSDVYAEDEYDRWRDDQCEIFEMDLKEFVDKHLHPKKHGYYKDMPERFLEHTVESLKRLTNCELTAFENRVSVVKKAPVTVEVVESFREENTVGVKT